LIAFIIVKKKIEKYLPHKSALGCFYCGVDSAQLKWFLVSIIGGLFAASFCVFLYGLSSGKFANDQEESLASMPIELEGGKYDE